MTISTVENKDWSILSLIEWGTQFLNEKGFDDARLNVELLLCNILNYKRIDLYLKFDHILSPDELANFKSLFRRRLLHEPLQYIIGETEFMGLRFQVDARVFIPRADTEVLVEQVVKYFGQESNRTLRILDIGTGSGNISISIAKFLQHYIIDTIDISPDALEVALSNIRYHQLEDRITLIHGDVLEAEQKYIHSPYDIIVSNPPYIPEDEFRTLQPEVRDHEPVIANTDHADGLTFYKSIAALGNRLLQTEGTIFVEIGYDQSESVPNIFRQSGYRDINLIQDYNGINRVVKASK
jgi:release factor glutamine methyltransferase